MENPRLHIVYGLRGGGKTTLLFQRFLDYPEGKHIYISGDGIKLLKISLMDVFRDLYYVLDGGAIFIEEINSIDGWVEELKVAYDSYSNWYIYVSGSSSLNLLESKKVLARRARYYHLLPMTFREYIKITRDVDLNRFDLLSGDVYTNILRYDIYFKQNLSESPVDLVNEYLSKSHPFLLEATSDMIEDLVEKIIYDDITKAYKFDSDILNKFERLIFILATSDKITYENVSTDLKISKTVVGKMIRALLQSSIIKQIFPYSKRIHCL